MIIRKATYIPVSKPLNLKEGEENLFQFKGYKVKALSLKKYRNCFVTFNGIGLKSLILMRSTVYHYPTSFIQFYKKALLQWVVSRFTRSGKIKQLEKDKSYALIFQPWFNYYHWMLESLPRLLLLKDQWKEITLFLPLSYRSFPFVEESLKTFPIKEIQFIEDDFNLSFEQLWIPALKPFCHQYDPAVLQQLKTLYLPEHKINAPLRLFINRDKASFRKIVNKEAVSDILKKYNFVEVDMEGIPFREQVLLASQTRYLISQHGAGLTNMLFMDASASVLELHKKITNPADHHSLVYWTLASALGLKYYHQLCEPLIEEENFFKADIVVDTKMLESNIKLMLEA